MSLRQSLRKELLSPTIESNKTGHYFRSELGTGDPFVAQEHPFRLQEHPFRVQGHPFRVQGHPSGPQGHPSARWPRLGGPPKWPRRVHPLASGGSACAACAPPWRPPLWIFALHGLCSWVRGAAGSATSSWRPVGLFHVPHRWLSKFVESVTACLNGASGLLAFPATGTEASPPPPPVAVVVFLFCYFPLRFFPFSGGLVVSLSVWSLARGCATMASSSRRFGGRCFKVPPRGRKCERQATLSTLLDSRRAIGGHWSWRRCGGGRRRACDALGRPYPPIAGEAAAPRRRKGSGLDGPGRPSHPTGAPQGWSDDGVVPYLPSASRPTQSATS